MPAIDIAERAVVVSLMESPMDWAIGAIYLKDSPRSAIPIVPALAACVKRSATIAESEADKPNPVIASATMVATEPRLSPEAAVASKTPPMPSRICCVLQPAFAISVMASATSPEEKEVDAPKSIA